MEFAFGLTATHWVILGSFFVWILYTANAHKLGQKTISSTLRNMSWDFSSFAFVWGMLMTHWFAPKRTLPTDYWGWMVGAPLILGLLVWDLYRLHHNSPKDWYRWPFFYVVAGMPIGYFFWPQLSPFAPF